MPRLRVPAPPAPRPAIAPFSSVIAPPVYRPGQRTAAPARIAQPHTVLQQMPGMRIERRMAPPVYRPGAPAVSAKMGGPFARPGIVQRSALEQHAAYRAEYEANMAAVFAAYARTITATAAREVVDAHPPDDQYMVESTDNYIARVRHHLDARDYKGRPSEKPTIETALTNYRADLAAEIQRAADEKRASLAILAGFEREATTRPATAAIKTHMFSAEVDGGVPKGLHAYTNGNLPAGTNVLLTIGDVNEVHVLVWTKATAPGKCKFSTMFPKYMPVGMVCWYLLNKRVSGTFTTAGRPAVPPYAWKVITMGQSGATNFPEYAGTEADIRNAIKGAADSYRTAVVNRVTQLYITKGGREYLLAN